MESTTGQRRFRLWDNQRDAALVFILLAVALVLRLLFVLKVAPGMVHGDQADYLGAAQRLLAGEPMPIRNFHQFVRPPGYSLFVGLVWLVSGVHTVMAAKVANAFVGVGTCFYIYLIGRRLGGRTGGLVALAIAAGYPYFIHFTSMAGSETLATLFVAAGTYHLSAGLAGGRPEWRQVIVGSALFSIGNLVRPNLMVLWPMVGIWLVVRYWPDWRVIGKLALALGVPLVLLALPWSLAVARQGLGQMFITDGSGIYYYMGHNESARKLNCDKLSVAEENALFAYADALSKDPVYLEAAAAPQGQQSSVFWRGGLAWDRQNLGSQPCLAVGKLWGFWRPWVNPAAYGRSTVLVSALAFPMLALGLFGLWRAREGSSRAYAILVALQLLAATGAAVVFSTQVRYRIQTVDPVLIPFAGFAAAWLLRRFRG